MASPERKLLLKKKKKITITNYFRIASFSQKNNKSNDKLYLRTAITVLETDAQESGERSYSYFPFQGKTDNVLANIRAYTYIFYTGQISFSPTKKFSRR